MQDVHVRPRTVQFEDETHVQNALSSTNTRNSSVRTVSTEGPPPSRPLTDTSGVGPQEEFGEDRCYECLAVGDDGDEDGGEVEEDDGDRIDVADDPMADSGPVDSSGVGHSTNVTPTQSRDVTVE